jgi:hypothetical protein
MVDDRRNFLKLFGVTTAAVATADGLSLEKVEKNLPDPRRLDAVGDVGSWVDHLERISERLYSKIEIPENTMVTCHQAFHYAIGSLFPAPSADGSVRIAKNYDTNMRRANCLPPPLVYMLERIGVVFSPAVPPAARDHFAEWYNIEFRLGDKVYFSLPVAHLSRIGLDRDVLSTNGGMERHFMPVKIPIIFDAFHHFEVSFLGEPLMNHPRIAAWAVFDGVMARPRQ